MESHTLSQEEVEKIIREYLPQIVHMSLATYADGKPWVCEVHFACDNELNIYFCSKVDRRHCEEIRKNPHVAGNMVTQHSLNQKVRGVYFEGTAEQIEDLSENHPAFQAFHARFDTPPQAVQAAQGEGKARYYKITASDFYLFDGYESVPSQKYHLDWKK
jgi:uncharacterized protein YhbP (UPF0306 family)